MGDEDDGLGLSLRLSLGCAQNHHHHHPSKLNLMSLATSPTMQHNTTTWNQLFHSSDRVSWFRGINVNRETTDCEDERWVSSPNSNISSISGKKNEREQVGDETEAEIDSCSRASDDEDGVAAASRKKLRLSKEQSLKKPSRKIALLIWLVGFQLLI